MVAMFKECDLDHDYKLTMSEFKAFYKCMTEYFKKNYGDSVVYTDA